MLDKAWVHLCRVDPAYERGARNFVQTVAITLGGIDMIVCPCKDCRNVDRHSCSEVVDHLVIRGMDEGYKLQSDWYHHGEVNLGSVGETKETQWHEEILGLYESQVQLVQKVHQLQTEIEKIKKQGHEPEIGVNSAARSVNKKSPPKCLLVDWSGSDENIAEGCILSSDPDDLVNDCRLGPTDLKILVEKSIKSDAFLWRPASNIYTIEEAVGKMIAWPASKCVLVDKGLLIEDIAPAGLRANSMNKCKLLDLSSDDVIVAEGRWETQERCALVNGIPLGPMAVKVFVDLVVQPETFIWRPTMEMTYLEDCFMTFVAWPVKKVVFDNPQDATVRKSPIQNSAATTQPSGAKSIASGSKQVTTSSKNATTCGKSRIEEYPPTVLKSHVKKTLQESQSPLRRSKRNNQDVVKDNKKCVLMDVFGKRRVVVEGRRFSNDPNQNVHF